MKGSAKTLPTNHVLWQNGFKSNMPDWRIARKCAIADRMHYVLGRVRSLMLKLETAALDRTYPDATVQDILKDPSWKTVFDSVYECVDIGDGMIGDPDDSTSRHNPQVEAYPMPRPFEEIAKTPNPILDDIPWKPMPKPPGVK